MPLTRFSDNDCPRLILSSLDSRRSLIGLFIKRGNPLSFAGRQGRIHNDIIFIRSVFANRITINFSFFNEYPPMFVGQSLSNRAKMMKISENHNNQVPLACEKLGILRVLSFSSPKKGFWRFQTFCFPFAKGACFILKMTSVRDSAREGWLASSIHRGLLHALTPTVITFLGLLAGVLGAVYTKEIEEAFPFHLTRLAGGFSFRALSFWFCALFSAILFFFREQAVAKDRKKEQQDARVAQEALIQRARELEHLIRTHPPANFLAIFARLYDIAALVEGRNFGAPQVTTDGESQLAADIRLILRLVATLAQKFDGDNPDVRYAANIMVFKATKDLRQEERSEIKNRLQFCDEDLDVQNLRGILDVELPLSTTASDIDSKIDDGLVRFALPIPQNPKSNGRSRVLPGAPMAFVDKVLDMYVDTRNLHKWCDENGDFTVAVKHKLKSYFEAHEQVIRSFVSIPIFGGSALESDNPIAVLNIHSNKPNLLKGDGEPVTHFVDLIRPFQLVLSRLLMVYLALNTKNIQSTAVPVACPAPQPVAGTSASD
jgi:hypothetical protein